MESSKLRTPSSWQLLDSSWTLGGSQETSWRPTNQSYHDNARGIHLHWNSRAHRKGIPALPIDAETLGKGKQDNSRWTVQRAKTRFWGWDLNDISWWIAFIFTVGSVFWCVNGILFFCYYSRSDNLAYTNTEAATAFLGGSTFLIGAYLGWVESLNPARDADFAWVIDEETKTLIEPDHHKSSIGRKRHHFGRHAPPPSASDMPPSFSGKQTGPSTESSPSTSPSRHRNDTSTPAWRWYGATRSVAYIANTVQLFGASTFFISTLVGLPGILPKDGGEAKWLGAYWAMQIIGAPCFVFAGLAFCLETQKHWWLPNLTSIGWQVGFWNLIGGLGFWFCGIFGIWSETATAMPYQYWGTAFSTFAGSWAFLLGSYIQLYETLNKRP